MAARRVAAALTGAVAVALGGAAIAGRAAPDGGPGGPVTDAAAPASAAEPGAASRRREVARAPRAARPPAARRGGAPRKPLGARLLRRVWLRERPGGLVVRALGPRTGYGSQRILAVVARRGDWLGVLSHHMPNSRAGWIPRAGARLLHEPYTLRADLSDRELVVRREGRVVRRIVVAVGRPGSSTPTGRFAITDALRTATAASPYGCCALALTGRQPDVPQGWGGGDRMAIHGTTRAATLGTPASSGCLRARDGDMRWLLANVPLGTTLRIRA